MNDWSLALLTAALTLLGGIVIFSITRLLDLKYFTPYYGLKGKLALIKAELLFSQNILTNKTDGPILAPKIFELATVAQTNIRKHWSELMPVYQSARIFPLTRKIPTEKEIDQLQKNLLYLSNFTTTVQNEHEELKTVNTSLKQSISLIDKYLV